MNEQDYADDSGGSSNTEHYDEEQLLIVDAKRGVESARVALLLRFEGLVRRYIERRMGERLARYATAEDLLQEVLFRGSRAIDKLREGARAEDFRGLLLQHAQWVLLERGRKSGQFMGESVMAPEPAADSAEAPERPAHEQSTGAVTVNDMNDWLQKLVHRLDEKYASVVRLYLMGKSYEEISAELEITEQTARKRFLRAARQLKEMSSEPGT